MRQAIILFLCFMLLTSNLLYSKLLNQNIPDANRLTISSSGFRKEQSNFILKKWNKTFSAADHLAEPVWLNDSSFVISYELKHPQMAILTSNFGSYDIYITPGDNIKIILTSVYMQSTLYCATIFPQMLSKIIMIILIVHNLLNAHISL